MLRTKKVQKSLLSIILAAILVFQSMTTTVLSYSNGTQNFKSFAEDILTEPDSPVPQSFDPTSIKDIKAADPGSKVNLIEPPEVNNQGSANLSYPIEVPPGRNGMQAQVGITYNSEGDNGWLGLGWDLSTSSITVDTRWGVPRYNSELETETYVLDGSLLSPVAYKDEYVAREAEKQFFSMIESDFKRIIRHGNAPNNYWWEVTTKSGIHYYYGGKPEHGHFSINTVLSDPENGNIFKWPLVQVKDTFGNTVDYEYERVGDSVEGVQLYPKAIYYTGKNGNYGEYKVEFIKSEYMDIAVEKKRPDVIIDARPGFKTLTKHFLQEIKVSFQEELIRSYRLEYETGQFEKSLLKNIIQLDGMGNEFNRHSLNYYDTMEEGYTFQRGNTLQTGEDEAEILNIIGVNAGPLGSWNTSGVGFHSYGGIGVGPKKVLASAGMKVGYKYTYSDEKIGWLDINGDGLTDKIIEDSKKIYYRPAYFDTNGQIEYKQDRVKVEGLDSLGVENTHVFCGGPEAYVVMVTAGFNAAYSKTTGKAYFSDVNGDGLVDYVKNGQVRYNVTKTTNVPQFSLTPPSRIGSGGVDGEGLKDIYEELDKDTQDNNPLMDIVRAWIAPFDGEINITGSIKPLTLVEQGLDDKIQPIDGMRASIQKNTQELGVWNIPGNDFVARDHDIDIEVNKGDRIYFRVNSKFDGDADRVDWNPQINYTRVLDSGTYTDVDASYKDYNDLYTYKYEASQDFTYFYNKGFMVAPQDGDIKFEIDVEKTEDTTDEAQLILSRITYVDGSTDDWNEQIIRSEQFNWNDKKSITVSAAVYDVSATDTFRLRIKTHTPIDAKAFNVSGKAYYTMIMKNKLDSEGRVVLDSSNNPVMEECREESVLYTRDELNNLVPNYKVNLAYDVDTYSQSNQVTPRAPYEFPVKGEVVVKVEMNSCVVDNNSSYFSIKKYMEFLYKKDLSDMQYSVNVEKGEKAYFDITCKDEGTANTVLDSLFTGDEANRLKITMKYTRIDESVTPEEEKELTTEKAVDCVVNWAKDPVSEYVPQSQKAYRGWYHFAYNANNNRHLIALDEYLIKKQMDDSKAEVEALQGLPKDQRDNYAQNRQDEIKNMDEDDIGATTKEEYIYFLFPDIESLDKAHWFSEDEDCWIDARYMQSSRKGMNKIYLLSDASGGSSMRGVVRVGKSTQTTGSVGLLIPYVGGSLGYARTKGDSYSEIDFIDMNGDSYPDVIRKSKGIQYTRSDGGMDPGFTNVNKSDNVRELSNKCEIIGFGANIPAISQNSQGRTMGSKNGGISAMMPSLGIQFDLNQKDAKADTKFDLYDMNGDGLPDKVKLITSEDEREGRLEVSLNLGYRFDDYKPWIVSNGFINNGGGKVGFLEDVGVGIGFNSDGAYSYGGGFSYSSDSSEVSKMLIDVNGDSLPDLVKINENDGMKVAFNLGNSFTGFRNWSGNIESSIRSTKSYNFQTGGYFSVTIGPFIPTPLYLIMNFGNDLSTSLNEQRTTFMDVNGDGLIDQTTVDGNSISDLKVAYNITGYTNKLKTVERPLGSKFTLSYKREGNTIDMPQSKWVLSKLEVYDGHSGDGIDNSVNEFSYSGGKYDRYEREFLGFADVEENQIDENGNVYRKSKMTFDTSSYFKKGLILISQIQENTGGSFVDLSKTVYEYDTLDLQRDSADPNTRRKFVFLSSKTDYYYEGTDYLSTYNKFIYDDHGNVTETFEAGNPGTQDDVVVKITYFKDLLNYIVDRPQSLRVYNNTNLLRRREGRYEGGTGALRALKLFDGIVLSETLFDYDEYGNIIKTTGPTDANGQRYKVDITYDTVTNTYPQKVTDSFGYTSESNYDYRFGLVKNSKDINSQVIENQYDSFGRLTKVFSPYDGTMPSVEFKYYHSEIPARAVTYNKIFHDQSNTETIDTVIFVDGIGRVIQTKKEGFVQQKGETQGYYGMNVSGLTMYDAFGRAVKQGQPVFQKGYDIDKFYPVTLKRPTANVYDSKDRVTQVILADSNTITTSYSISGDSFKAVVTDPEGKVKNSYTDITGNLIKVEQFNGTRTITGTYKYNALRENTEVIDDNGNKTIISYDMLGRTKSVDNPDMGLVEYTYDGASNLLTKVDGNLRLKSQAVNYIYEYNRLIKIDYPGMQDVEYIYGGPGASDNAAGRIIKIIDEPGDIEYSYGRLGEQTQVKRRIKYVGGLIGLGERTYLTKYNFDYLGRIESMVYPDREKITYFYDLGGQVIGVHGSKHQKDVNMYNNNCKNGIHNECYEHDYVRDIRYDEFGQRIFMELGNGTKTNYTYDPYRRWLSNVETGDNFGVNIQDIDYTFDRTGNVLGYKNTASKVVQKYTYDDLYQLVKAEGLGSIRSNSSISHYEQTFEYDNLGNMTRKTSDAKIFGSYMISSNFVNEANLTDSSKLLRDGLVNPDWCEKPHEDIYKFTYEYTNPQPHAAKRIGNWVFEYDANGNTVKRWRVLVDSADNVIKYDEDTVNFGPSDRFKWDEENRLKESVVKGKPTIYVYDYSGKRTNKSHENSEEVYVSEFYQERHNREGIKNIYVGTSRLVSQRFTVTNLINENFDQNKEYRDVYYYHKDHLGSANVMSDFEGRSTQHYENKPYGESWINEKRDHIFIPYLFNGKEYDQENRLYYYGERYLDPMFSRWLSPDPALESYIPAPGSGTNLPGIGGVFNLNNLNVYHYANNNPINYVDPDGRSSEASQGRLIYNYAMSKYRENERNKWNAAVSNFKQAFQQTFGDLICHSVAQDMYTANVIASLVEANNGRYKGGFYLGYQKLNMDVKLDLLNMEFVFGLTNESPVFKAFDKFKIGIKTEGKYDILNNKWEGPDFKPRLNLSAGQGKVGLLGAEGKIPLTGYAGVFVAVDHKKQHKPFLLNESYMDIYERLRSSIESNN